MDPKAESIITHPSFHHAFDRWAAPVAPREHDLKIIGKLGMASKNSTLRGITAYKNAYKNEISELIHRDMSDECRETVATLFSLDPNGLTRQIEDIKINNSPGKMDTIKTRLKFWLTYFGLNINTIPNNLFNCAVESAAIRD